MNIKLEYARKMSCYSKLAGDSITIQQVLHKLNGCKVKGIALRYAVKWWSLTIKWTSTIHGIGGCNGICLLLYYYSRFKCVTHYHSRFTVAWNFNRSCTYMDSPSKPFHGKKSLTILFVLFLSSTKW